MVHNYKLNNQNIVLDVESGSIHIVDDITYEIISEYKKESSFENAKMALKSNYNPQDIDSSIEELQELIKDEMLFTNEEENEKIYKSVDKEITLKALCLHVAHDCNLSCDYCFADKGSYKQNKSIMHKEIGIKAVDYLIKHSGNRKNIEIDFFGGEPLLNMDTVIETVKYAKSIEEEYNKKFHFTITTNGILLNEKNIEYINEYMDNIVISIDGRKETHDAIRKDNGGNATYDRILPKAKKLVNSRGKKSYFIRSTFTARNLDFTKDFIDIVEKGFKEISIEPAIGIGQDFSITEEMLPTIFKEYEKLANEYIIRKKNDNSLRFYHYNMNLYEGPCIYKRINSCGAGYEYFAVSPEGDFYPCHQFVGTDKFKVGDIFNGINNLNIVEQFKNNNIFAKKECRDCFAKYHCSGGCHSNAYFVNGDINIPDKIACQLQRKRVECAIMIKAVELDV